MGYKKNPEFNQKVQECLDLLVSYTPTMEIHKIIGAKYNIKNYAVDRYIRQARDLWAKRDVSNIEDKRARALKTLQDLYFEAYKDRKFNICVQVQDQINKLNQAYPKEQVEEQKESVSISFITKGADTKEEVKKQ